MKSYFFVPADKTIKIPALRQQGADTIIIDLEDAMKESEREALSVNILQQENLKDCFLRVPVYSQYPDTTDLTLLRKFLAAGFSNFVIPKLFTVSDLRELLKVTTQNSKIILLIESPRFYLELINTIADFGAKLYGLGLGSHDFMAETGGIHTLANLDVLRTNILFMARAYGLEAIDIASMNVSDEDNFKSEVMDGFNKGYSAKFVIHPWQHKLLSSLQYYSAEEFALAKKIIEKLAEVKDKAEFNAIIIDGKIIEKPHIDRAKRIYATLNK